MGRGRPTRDLVARARLMPLRGAGVSPDLCRSFSVITLCLEDEAADGGGVAENADPEDDDDGGGHRASHSQLDSEEDEENGNGGTKPDGEAGFVDEVAAEAQRT